jgi:lysophospholipase L1-like esterase
VRFAKIANVNDGDVRSTWAAGRPTPEQPAWVALDIGRGASRVVLSWSSAGSFNYDETDYGSPGAYRIETSADSRDGSDGAWVPVAQVEKVGTHARAHSFDFAGKRWVKFVVTGAPAASPNGVQIDEIEVRDATGGVRDSWFFMGDSVTAFAFGRAPPHEIDFGANIQHRHPPHSPLVINGGIGGEKSDEGLRHIDEWLTLNPDARFWCLAYGTNDSAGDATDTAPFRANLGAILGRVQGAGRIPILASIPFAADGQHANIPRFNDVIADLRVAHSLPKGPDLYAWFAAHPEELRDGLHPNDRGVGSINRLWADAVETLYRH